MPYERKRFSADTVEELVAQLNEEHENLFIFLLQPDIESISWAPKTAEPRRIDGQVVFCAGGVTWNGQNLTRGLKFWDANQNRWERV